MAKSKKKAAAGGKSQKRPPNVDLLKQYSPYIVGNIPATSTKKKADTFESYVPKDGVCLDYNVSQTFLRMDAGSTKINIKDTTATYVPVPPEILEQQAKRKKGPKFGRGIPPQWVFEDEILLQKQNELQEIHKKELLKFVKQRKKNDMLKGRSTHNRIQSLVGPEWYQELSPNQMETTDELKSCILKDIKDSTIINTQENIGRLGLVLRPNHRHIALALRLCCKCPVEFLLILYQLINPNRSQYSLNDRLLLSAVVHLTMKDTLREMHVRIPSPPKPEKVPVKAPKKPKQKTYISPYLKPYTFKPTLRKYTGIYENKHVQYPESPYFEYRESLIIQRIIGDDVLELDESNIEPEEQELIEDWKQAQMIYDNMQQDEKVKLIKPTIVMSCLDFENYCAEELVILEAQDDNSGGKGNRKRGEDDNGPVGGMGGGSKGTGPERNEGGGEGGGSKIPNRSSARGEGTKNNEEDKNKGGGFKGSIRRSSTRPIKEEPELILPPLAKLEDDDVGDKCDCHPNSGICREHRSLKPCKECIKRETSKECNCKQRAIYLKKYKKGINKIIGGVVMTNSGTAVPIISGISPPNACNWVDTLTEALKKCGYCQMIMDTIICSEHQMLQPCEDCRRYTNACNCRDRLLLLKEYRRHTQKMIGGVMLTKGNVPVPIISGIAPPRSGDWVQALEDIERKCQYCERTKDLEKCCEHQLPEPCEECKRQCMTVCDCREKSKLYTTPKCKICLMKEFKKNTQKWIGGVTLTRSNTVIPIISGLVPPKTCDCVQEYKYKIMAVAERNKIQCHKTNFIIGGVTITRDGPVYILSAALRKRRREIPTRRVCKTIKEKGEEKPKVKRELGPYDCTCGRDSSDEEENEDEERKKESKYKAPLKIDNGDGDAENVEDCTLKKDKKKKKTEKEGSVCKRGRKVRELNSDNENDEDSKKCTCKKHKESTPDFAFSKPCECRDLCDCKEASKLVTENKCEKCLEKRKLQMVERIMGGVAKMGRDVVPIVQGTRFQDSCECLQDYKDKIIGIAARNRIMNQKAKFVVIGVSSTKEGPVYILSSAVGKKPKKKKRRKEAEEQEDCVCKEPRKKESYDEEPFQYSCCRCKQELDRFLSHKCTCEECMEVENRRNVTYIKSGVKYTESGNVIDILSGIYGQKCNCLEKYLEKIAALEDYRKRIEARYHLKSHNLKYAIGGVVNTPNGPVYVISGMRPPVECECARVLQQKLEEQEQQSRMPKMPPTGRIKYEISGVKQMSQENVFIVSHALAVDDCDCMKLYNNFEQAHKTCLDMYEEYLKQAQEAIDEYNNEMTGEPKMSIGEAQLEEDEPLISPDTYEDAGEYNLSTDTGELERKSAEITSNEQLDSSESKGSSSEERQTESTDYDSSDVVESEESSTEEYTASESESSTQSSTDSIPAVQLKFTPSGKIDTSLEEKGDEKGQECAVNSEIKKDRGKQEQKQKKQDRKKEAEQKDRTDKYVNENQELKRFVILKKIPCKEQKQQEIVKRVLETMAEDGYPLAKLPDCHKLPHFKLWMQMRCGMFWRQKDRRSYELLSKVLWCHTNICHRAVARPQLGIDKAAAKLMTWKDAAFIRQIVSDKVGMYYRLVRQENIETVREFFPLTFSYEFPTPTFRDCFFAYLPSKEEDLLVYRIMKPHEARVNLKKFPCY